MGPDSISGGIFISRFDDFDFGAKIKMIDENLAS